MPNYTSDFPEVKKWARYFQKFFESDNQVVTINTRREAGVETC